MKKIRLIPLFLASTLVLGACTMPSWFPFGKKDNQQEEEKEDSKKTYDINPEIEGGTDAEKKAILEALNIKPICQQFAKSSVTVYPDSNVTLEEHKYQSIKFTTRQKMGDLFVDITWDVDETQEYFGKLHHLPDGVHDLLEIKYKGYNQPEGSIKWKLKKVVCGDAVANPNIEYTAKVKNETYVHDHITLAELYAVTDGEQTFTADGITYHYPSTFDKVNYTESSRNKDGGYSPFWTPNNPDAADYPEYYYISVPGKVVYTSPDGNWGLLADGKNVLEIYAGSGTAFLQENWPNLAGKYVRVEGNCSLYNGNTQMGYVTKIAALSDEEKAAVAEPEPLVFREMDASALAALKVEGYTGEKMAVMYPDGGCLMNGLAQVTGEYVAESLKVDDSAVQVDALKNTQRCTFELKVGEQKIVVAYDYHTDRDGTHGVMAALKTALKKTGEITIKGTMRYNGDKGFIAEGNKGVWNIVPFLAEHIA